MFINVTAPGHQQAPGGPVQAGKDQHRIEGSFLDEKNQCCHWRKKNTILFSGTSNPMHTELIDSTFLGI